MITIQFSTTDHFSSRCIRYLTWSWASHVDFVLPDGMLLGALAFAHGGGVRLHSDLPKHKYSRVERYIVDAPDEVIDAAKSQVGKPYDFLGLAGYLFRNRKWEEDDKWFCSELVAYSFAKAGHPLVISDANRITPRDLLLSPKLQRVDF